MRNPLSDAEFRMVGLTVFAIGCVLMWIASRVLR